MLKRKHSILFLIFAFLPLLYNAQTEAEMKVQADKLFLSEQYLEATPLYLRLLSLQPRDLEYNYRYGTCLLYNSNRKQEAIKYLSFAVNDPNVSPEAYYYLGKALHLNYQFNEAIKQYTTYIEKRKPEGKVHDAERDIQMCQNGKRLMTTISDIIVLDKKELTTDKFFRVYELKDIGGNLLVTAEFQTKLDKKNNHIPLIHFPQNPSVIYYSSYGDNANTGKDIYVRRKLPDGSWGLPQPIPGNVNTQFDEDFPYMHPDGNYLYFSSKGHNSMGGYDVFRSKYDPENNSFGPPENMDFAISSPDDDLFYVVDSLNSDAYFASARQSEIGKLFVYKVKVDRVPIQLAVIKGNFVSEIDPTIKKINFEIKDYANGDNIGKFNSNDKAVYLITFPKGGKYEFVMNIEGSSQEFRSIVSIPFMKEFKPLKQKIVHTMEEGREIVRIVNLFNEEVDDPQAVIAEVIKMRSTLDVNVNEFNLEELEAEKANKEILSELGLGDLLLTEVSDVLKDQVKKGTESKNLQNTISNNINTLVVENSADFIRLEEQIKAKVAESNTSQDSESKYILLKEAEAMIKKQEELKKYSKDLLRLNDSVKGVLSQSNSSADVQKMKEISNQFDQLYREGKEKEALQVIAGNKDVIVRVLNDNSGDLVQNLVDKVVKYDEEISASKSKVDGYNRELKDLEIEIQSLQNSNYSAKKKDVPAIESKIAAKQDEYKLIEEERNIVQKTIDQKSVEKYQINKQIQILQDAISNKSIATVNKEQATKAVAETEKINSNTLTAYVNQQMAELEKKDPTLKDRIVVSSGLKAQNIFEEYKASEKGILDDPKLSKEDRLYKLLANERTAIRQLDLRLEEIEKLKAENKFDENLNREKQALLTYKNEITGTIAQNEKQVEALVAKDGVGDPETVISTIQPDYNENKQFIESNNNLNPQEKAQALNKEDEKLLTAVETELKKIDNQLIKTPDDKTIQTKQATLNKIKEDTEKAIEKRNESLETSTDVVNAPTATELIKELAPGYEQRKIQIGADKTLSSKEKLIALNKEDQQLVGSVENEIKEVEVQLSKTPNDKNLLAKKEVLNSIKKETEAAIEERTKEINATSDVTLAKTPTEIINELSPDYVQNKDAIEADASLTTKEKLIALNKEDQKLVVAVEKEIKGVETQLSKTPNDKNLLAKKEVLNAIKKETEAAIEERTKEINATSDVTLAKTPTEIINELSPDYVQNKNAIEADASLTTKEKLIALNKEDQQLLVSVEKEIKGVETQLSKTPNDKNLLARKVVLNAIKKETEAAIEQRNKEINATSDVATKSELIEELDPTYKEKKDAISADNSLTKKEQLTTLNKLDQELAEKAALEIQKINDQLDENPADKAMQAEKETLLSLNKELNSTIENRNNELKTLESTDITSNQPNALIEKIEPGYTKAIESINNNESLTSEEKMKQLQLKDQELIESIDSRSATLEKQIAKNPNDQILNEEKAQLTELRSLTESNMEEREQLIESKLATNLTAENIAEQKNILRNKIDASYDKKIEAARSKEGTPLDKMTAELKVEQAMLDKISVEENQVRKSLSKDPFNSELKTKLIVLNDLHKDSQSNIDGLKKDIETLNSGQPLITVSETDKNEKIANLAPAYTSVVESIQAADVSDAEKAPQLLEEENQLLNAIRVNKENVQEQLKNNPSDRALQKELMVLEELQKEVEARIADQEKTIRTAEELPEVTQAQKADKIKELDPEYAETIRAIESDVALTETEKQQQIQTADQKLLGKVYEDLEKVETQLETDPRSNELKAEQNLLNTVSNELEKQIEERQLALNKIETLATITNAEKEQLIEQLDPTFQNDVAVIQKLSLPETEELSKLQALDRKLLSKAIEALDQLDEKLAENPNDPKILKEKAVLEALINDLKKAIESREDALQGTSTETLITESQKSEMIDRIDPTYAKEKQAIEKNTDLTSVQKAEQLVELGNDLLEKVSSEKIKTQEKLNEDPSNTSVKKELAILESVQQEVEKTVAEQKELTKGVTVTEDLKAVQERMIVDVYPDYSSKKETIESSKMPEIKKLDERIKLETDLLTKLQSEERSLDKLAAKEPDNKALQQKREAVKALIANQKQVLESLNTQKAQLLAAEKESTLVAEADETYEKDIERLKTAETATRNSDLAEREAVHQERLTEQIAANEKSLEKKANPELSAETEILKSERAESKVREDNYRSTDTSTPVDSEIKESYIANLREDLLQGNVAAVSAQYNSVEDLKEQDAVLESYENTLVKQIEQQTELVAKEPENTKAKDELAWLKEELKTVQQKRRQVKITIGELEKIEVIQEPVAENRFDDPELKKLALEENKLEQQLEDPSLTTKEKQVIQKELNQVQKEKAVQETSLLTKEIDQEDKTSTELTTSLKESATVNEETQVNTRSALAQQKELENQSAALVKEANATKNPDEKNYLLNEALNKQEKSNDLATQALVENEIQKLEEANGIKSLETTADLEQKKRRYTIQIGELTKLMTILDEDIAKAKGKEAEALKKERNDKAEQKALIQKQLDLVNEQLAAVESTPSTIPAAALEQTVSYNEERDLAATDTYRNYEEKATAALAVEKQIANLEAQLEEEKTKTKQLVAESVVSPSEENKAKVQSNVNRIKEMETDLENLKSELTKKQTEANLALPANTEEAMKMQNLVKRGIKPIQKMAVVAALVPLPANGLEINANGTNTYSAAKPIPVDVKNPTGLVYRVQVGAFAKPIPQDLFKEFNPVSGEKLNNSNITRYMAGFFNNSAKVVEARDQIKALGYSDAFAVAYCDGKRITLAEARILEANGECVAKGENELMMEIATNTASKMGLIDSTGTATVSLPKVEEYTYNQVAGSVKAEPVEKHLGLFYTVQVGVFNRPVNAKTVYNIEPLMTQRLPNGQIRYSAGMFNSVDEARPKKAEAVEKGIKDAFITAYYNGERITLAEALRLLNEKGTSILENNILKKGQASTTVENSGEKTVTTEPAEPEVEVKKERVQIITKKTFEEFPREILNRYNSHGSFYYDETDKRVKSAIANSRDELPQVFYFKDDVDTLVVLDLEDEPANNVVIKFTGANLPGDFIDWLLRFNYRREFTQTEEMIELRIYRIPDEKMPEMEAKLTQFGLNWTKEEIKE